MGLHENMLHEPVSRLHLRTPVTLTPGAKVREAIDQMRSSRLGCTIVVDADHKPLGMFTETMVAQLLVAGKPFLDDPIEQHMAEHWPNVGIDDPVADILDIMQSRNVRFICVIDGDGKLVGLTGQKGLLEYVADHFPEQVMVQRIGTSPYMSTREGA